MTCGAELLYELAFTGTLSYLNQAQIIEWPEMTTADVLRLAGCSQPDPRDTGKSMPPIDETTAKKFLEFSGGHPGILDTCFELYSQNPGFTRADLIEKLALSSFLWQLLVPLCQDREKKEKIGSWLKSNEIGLYQPYLEDPLLKELYWKNLLQKDKRGKRLMWRSEALRLAVLRIMNPA